LRGVVDDLLEGMRLTRRIVATMPLFLPALAAVEATAAIATIARRIALRYAKAFNLVTSDPPMAIRSFAISAVRHRRDERSLLLNWLIGKLESRAASEQNLA